MTGLMVAKKIYELLQLKTVVNYRKTLLQALCLRDVQ